MVENIMEIHGNATSNIDYQGKVFISGSVVDHIRIRATEGIEILGGMGKASIESGADVSISGDIIGDKEGTIIASGNVTAGSAKEVNIVAGGVVSIDTITNSTIEAKKILAVDRKGRIVGGISVATHLIKAKSIGDKSGLLTEVKTGKIGKIAEVDTIFPGVIITLADRKVPIRKSLKKVAFRLEGSRIFSSSYTPTAEEEEQPSITSISQ